MEYFFIAFDHQNQQIFTRNNDIVQYDKTKALKRRIYLDFFLQEIKDSVFNKFGTANVTLIYLKCQYR